MRGGTLLAIFFILSFLAGAFLFQELKTTGNVIACAPNWTCSSWSNCIGGEKIRTCLDPNLCGITISKPNEKAICQIDCVPNWECSNWMPETCPETEIQTKECIDKNNCNSKMNMPESARNCEYKETYEWLFYVIVAINILTILLIIALIIGLSYKSSNKKERIISQKEIPMTPKIQKQMSLQKNQYRQTPPPNSEPIKRESTTPSSNRPIGPNNLQQTSPSKQPLSNQLPQKSTSRPNDLMPKNNSQSKFIKK